MVFLVLHGFKDFFCQFSPNLSWKINFFTNFPWNLTFLSQKVHFSIWFFSFCLFEEFFNIRMGAIARTKFLSNGNQMHQLQQKITSRQQFVDWTTWPCLKKGFFTLCLAQKHTFIFQFPLGIKLFWAQKHTFIFCFAWEWTLAEQHDLRNCAVSKWGLLHKKVDSISQQWQQLQTRLESKP